MRSPAARADMRLPYDDFVLFPDDGKRHEIIDGEHYVTPSPNVRHQRLVGRLLYEIEMYLKANPRAGEVFPAPLDVVLSHWSTLNSTRCKCSGHHRRASWRVSSS